MGTPFFHGDRVLVQTTTTGTGTYQLGPALDGFLTLAQVGIPSGSRVSYCIQNSLTAPTMFEIGEGIYTAGAPATIGRSKVIRTHGGGTSAVNWQAGTRYLFLAPHAGIVPLLDTAGLINSNYLAVGLQSQLRSSTAVSIANNTLSNYPWDTNDVNTLGLIAGTPAGVLTLQEDGVYRFQASLVFAGNGAGQRIMNLVVGGNAVRNQARARGDANVPTVLTVSWEAPLPAGTTARIDVLQDSGAVLPIGGGTESNFFVTRLR